MKPTSSFYPQIKLIHSRLINVYLLKKLATILKYEVKGEIADMEETISLQELFKILRKRLFMIISITILAVSIAGAVSYYFLSPIYQASTQILINQSKSETSPFSSSDIQTNLELINTYSVIIKNPAILSKVIDKLDLNTTPAKLYPQIKVNSEQSSQVVNITVQDTKYQRAVDVANTTVEVFQEEIVKLMNVDNVNVLSPAVFIENEKSIKPDSILNMVIASIIGLMLGVGITFLLEHLDTTIKTEQDIETLTGLPVLGVISPITEKDIKMMKSIIDSKRKKEVWKVV